MSKEGESSTSSSTQPPETPSSSGTGPGTSEGVKGGGSRKEGGAKPQPALKRGSACLHCELYTRLLNESERSETYTDPLCFALPTVRSETKACELELNLPPTSSFELVSQTFTHSISLSCFSHPLSEMHWCQSMSHLCEGTPSSSAATTFESS